MLATAGRPVRNRSCPVALNQEWPELRRTTGCVGELPAVRSSGYDSISELPILAELRQFMLAPTEVIALCHVSTPQGPSFATSRRTC